MPKYQIVGCITVGVFTTVEAENEQEALEKAEERSVQGLCRQCVSSENDEELWCLSDNIKFNEVHHIEVDGKYVK